MKTVTLKEDEISARNGVMWRIPTLTKVLPNDESDDGTHNGGWIRDLIRAKLEVAHGLALLGWDFLRPDQEKTGD